MHTVYHIDAFNSFYLQVCQDRSIIALDRYLCVSQYWQQELQKHYQVQASGATLFDYQSYRDEFFAFVEQSKIQIGKSLILPGVIFDKQLLALYRIADGFVFPSVKEGWGLVVLEAIAS